MTDFPVFDTTVEQTMQTEVPEKVPPIPVTITDPAQVRLLPAKTASFETFTLNAVAQKILGRDPRRKSATISIPLGESIVLGATQAEATSSGAVVGWHLQLSTLDEIWATGGADGNSGVIGVISEMWAD